jgi:hypothetical protein
MDIRHHSGYWNNMHVFTELHLVGKTSAAAAGMLHDCILAGMLCRNSYYECRVMLSGFSASACTFFHVCHYNRSFSKNNRPESFLRIINFIFEYVSRFFRNLVLLISLQSFLLQV